MSVGLEEVGVRDVDVSNSVSVGSRIRGRKRKMFSSTTAFQDCGSFTKTAVTDTNQVQIDSICDSNDIAISRRSSSTSLNSPSVKSVIKETRTENRDNDCKKGERFISTCTLH